MNPSPSASAAAWQATNVPSGLDLTHETARSILRSVLCLGMCFLLVYWGMSVAASLTTTLHPDAGFLAFALEYRQVAMRESLLHYYSVALLLDPCVLRP